MHFDGSLYRQDLKDARNIYCPSVASHLLLARSDRLRSILAHLLDRRALRDPLIPRPSRRVLLLPLVGEVGAHDMRRAQQQPVPRHEGQISVGQFVANQIGGASLLQMGVNDSNYATDFVAVAVEARIDLVLVVEGEPGLS